ncbi:MAG: hypothetical protein JST16_01135 [Bdellovibrionales bacterium]|nr:hypothetical protein [Bdellovibrionales bacterium]
MKHRYPLRTESKEVLLHLANYGTCSAKTLAWMTGRNSRKVREGIDLLAQKGLVTKLSLSIDGRPSVHCQLAQTSTARSVLSTFTDLGTEFFYQKGFPITQLRHEDLCAKLHFRINKARPEILVIRDWEMHRKPIPDSVLPKSFHRDGLLPDMILGIPSPTSEAIWSAGGFRWVAVELDRVRKKLDRVREKLNLYAKETQFDGLLYIFPERVMADNFGDYFDQVVAPKAIRVQDFKDVFLARAILGDEDQDLSNMTLRCGKSVIGFESWIELLSSTSSQTRTLTSTQLAAITAGNLKSI